MSVFNDTTTLFVVPGARIPGGLRQRRGDAIEASWARAGGGIDNEGWAIAGLGRNIRQRRRGLDGARSRAGHNATWSDRGITLRAWWAAHAGARNDADIFAGDDLSVDPAWAEIDFPIWRKDGSVHDRGAAVDATAAA